MILKRLLFKHELICGKEYTISNKQKNQSLVRLTCMLRIQLAYLARDLICLLLRLRRRIRFLAHLALILQKS